MPLLGSFGSASARGLGLTSGGLAPYNVDFDIAAGGGSGGGAGGAGGGGGYRQLTAKEVSPGDTVTITVGGGGSGPGCNQPGVQGTASQVACPGGFGTFATTGGGKGGGHGSGSPGGPGGAGGGAYQASGGSGNAGGFTPSEGNPGAPGGPGGGGGIGSSGGSGITTNYFANTVCDGANAQGGGSAGPTNQGKGGASPNQAQGGAGGGAGGPGVVELRVPTANYTGTTTGSPTVQTDGDFTELRYTGSGSYTA